MGKQEKQIFTDLALMFLHVHFFKLNLHLWLYLSFKGSPCYRKPHRISHPLILIQLINLPCSSIAEMFLQKITREGTVHDYRNDAPSTAQKPADNWSPLWTEVMTIKGMWDHKKNPKKHWSCTDAFHQCALSLQMNLFRRKSSRLSAFTASLLWN